PGAPERYSLYGIDELAAAGWAVEHNLEPGRAPGPVARLLGAVLGCLVRLAGGYSGDFASVLASLRAIARADVVFSTVDTVGIPLVLLGRVGLVRTPIVYVAIGLPERLAQLRGAGARWLYRSAYRRTRAIVAYGAGEVDALREWLGADGPEVVLVPFGVDTEAFQPDPNAAPVADVVSVGADPRRDWSLLVSVAARRPAWTFHVVASSESAAGLEGVPANVTLERDVPLPVARDRLAGARVVVLPVRENSYSGATTVLLQSMALAKPVVVSRTAALARGYHLVDGVNCRLVPPGSADALEQAVAELLADSAQAAHIGSCARETVERYLSWERYAGDLTTLLGAVRSHDLRISDLRREP
ncbi:MAG: glycosyltransferase family 4 protein, partial [Gaiellaceae bacterium]|nr:glycosyltransferase family 4 protein [Gaiellaceae bacterium]